MCLNLAPQIVADSVLAFVAGALLLQAVMRIAACLVIPGIVAYIALGPENFFFERCAGQWTLLHGFHSVLCHRAWGFSVWGLLRIRSADGAQNEERTMIEDPNPAHVLDGGIPSCFHIGRRWPAARDVRRWAPA